jgi:hypothetical protein
MNQKASPPLGTQVWLPTDDSDQWGQYRVVSAHGEWVGDNSKSLWEAVPEGQRVNAPVIATTVGGYVGQFRSVDRDAYITADRATELIMLAEGWRIMNQRAGVTFDEYFADKELTELELSFVRYRAGVEISTHSAQAPRYF